MGLKDNISRHRHAREQQKKREEEERRARVARREALRLAREATKVEERKVLSALPPVHYEEPWEPRMVTDFIDDMRYRGRTDEQILHVARCTHWEKRMDEVYTALAS